MHNLHLITNCGKVVIKKSPQGGYLLSYTIWNFNEYPKRPHRVICTHYEPEHYHEARERAYKLYGQLLDTTKQEVEAHRNGV